MPRDTAAISKAFNEIKGYPIKTDLDRKLLLGIWELERRAAPVKLAYASELNKSPYRPASNVSVNNSLQVLQVSNDMII